jgi:hypothetical protein
VAAGYIATMGRLAQLEGTQVVILNSANVSKVFAQRHKELRKLTAEYRVTIREEARPRHFDVVEREDVMRALAGEPDQEFVSDGIHRASDAHPFMANALAEAIARRHPVSATRAEVAGAD